MSQPTQPTKSPRYRFIRSVTFKIPGGVIFLMTSIEGPLTPMVLDTKTGTVYFATELEKNFAVELENTSPFVVATPARLSADTSWTNVFRECPEIDPSKMSSTGGMLELAQSGSGLEKTTINCFYLPNGGTDEFIASGATVQTNVESAQKILEIYYRPAAVPTIFRDGRFTIKADESEVNIAFGEVNNGEVTVADVVYANKATLIVAIHLVSRQIMSAMLKDDGAELDPDNPADWWLGTVCNSQADRYDQAGLTVTPSDEAGSQPA